MVELYCKSCDAGPWSEDALGSDGFPIVKLHRKLNHDVIEYHEPEKSIEQLFANVLSELDPIQKLIDRKESKKQDVLEEIVSFLKKEILQEYDNIYLVLLNGLSAYSSNPINRRILAPSSEGKTYLVNKISKLFPKTDVLNLSTASAQSFKYLSGERVVEDESGDFVPIEPKLVELEIQNLDKSKSKSELESIRTEMIQLKKNSWYMIDLSNKWLIFSDSQDTGLWEMLKTILSHDDEYIKHQVTNKIGGKNTTQRIVFKGKPAVTYCSAKDESKYQVSEEIDTRFDTVYLRTNPQKYKESIKLLSQKHGLPKLIYDSEVVSETEKLQAIDKMNMLIENITQYGSDINSVLNPFAAELAKSFPSESGSRSRQFDRFCQHITLVTLCYSSGRPKIKSGDKYYPVVTKSDIIKTINMMKESTTISTNKIQFFNDVIRQFLISIQDKDDYKVGLVNGSKYVITASELADYVKSISKKSNQDRKKILENYLEPLSEHGYLERAQDPRNRTRNIYWLAKPYEDKKAGLESTLIDISTISDSGVEVYIEKYIKRRFDSKELTILDKDNHAINPDQLYEIVTSIDIQTPQNRHDFDNVETSTDVENKHEILPTHKQDTLIKQEKIQ